MKAEKITEESIRALVHAFYAKVRADNVLAPVFDGVIGTRDEQWAPHLEMMCDFWSSLMLTSGRYHGNPMKKHQDIPAFDEALFDRWLALFEQTANALFDERNAALFVEKSQRVAQSLRYALYYKFKDGL